jgi:hypothetical protein
MLALGWSRGLFSAPPVRPYFHLTLATFTSLLDDRITFPSLAQPRLLLNFGIVTLENLTIELERCEYLSVRGHYLFIHISLLQHRVKIPQALI